VKTYKLSYLQDYTTDTITVTSSQENREAREPTSVESNGSWEQDRLRTTARVAKSSEKIETLRTPRP